MGLSRPGGTAETFTRILRTGTPRPPALLQFDLAEPLLEIIVGGDRRPFRGLARNESPGKRLDQEIRAKVQEERHRIARLARPVRRRIDYPMRGRGQDSVGQALKHVA